MKSILMISYFFPPEGSAGVYRPLRFVRQLASLGWETTVVTAAPYRYERHDPELVKQIPKNTEMIRVPFTDPWQALQAWRGDRLQKKLYGATVETVDKVQASQRASLRTRMRETIQTFEALYYIPDRAKPWIRPAVTAIREACGRKNFIAIWATISPVSAGVVARLISQEADIPYVLDFRDPWELYFYESESKRPGSVIRKAQRNMSDLFEKARAVVFLFPSVAECYCRAYQGALDPSKIHIIPNGYEGKIDAFRVPNGDRCTILYTGTLSTYRYETLLQAVRDLKMTHLASANRLKILFVGDGMDPLSRMSASLGISDIVQTAPPVSYDEVKRLSENAHAFLILGRHPQQKGHELVAGAKLFGYFKAGKPVMGVLPKDETKEILSVVGVETIADADSVTEIVEVMKTIHKAWSEDRLASLLPNPQACERYSSERQTLALIRALDGSPPEDPFVPGKVAIPPSLRKTIEDESLWYAKK